MSDTTIQLAVLRLAEEVGRLLGMEHRAPECVVECFICERTGNYAFRAGCVIHGVRLGLEADTPDLAVDGFLAKLRAGGINALVAGGGRR